MVLCMNQIPKRNTEGIMIVVHFKCTPPLYMGWALQCVGPTPCEGMMYICCTLGVQESLPIRKNVALLNPPVGVAPHVRTDPTKCWKTVLTSPECCTSNNHKWPAEGFLYVVPERRAFRCCFFFGRASSFPIFVSYIWPATDIPYYNPYFPIYPRYFKI